MCVRVCVRVCVRACVRACVRVCVCVCELHRFYQVSEAQFNLYVVEVNKLDHVSGGVVEGGREGGREGEERASLG